MLLIWQKNLIKKYLNSIVTSYPKFLVNKYTIENDKINTIVLKEVALKIINRFPLLKKKLIAIIYYQIILVKKQLI